MNKNKYFIILKIEKNQISIGDTIRVLEIFKGQDLEIVSDKKYNIFFRNFNKKNIIPFSKFKSYKEKKIINLVIGKKIKSTIFDINDHIDNKVDKISTFNIFKKLKKFKKKNRLKDIPKKRLKIGINWIVPINWKIKSYPFIKWKKIYVALNKHKNIDVSFQKKISLNRYITWIKSCDILISVVGLGVHIARYFEKTVIVLVGPTDFSESKNDKMFYKIFPKKRCSVHKKMLNVNYKNCNCMQNIDEKKIINKIFKIIDNGKKVKTSYKKN